MNLSPGKLRRGARARDARVRRSTGVYWIEITSQAARCANVGGDSSPPSRRPSRRARRGCFCLRSAERLVSRLAGLSQEIGQQIHERTEKRRNCTLCCCCCCSTQRARAHTPDPQAQCCCCCSTQRAHSPDPQARGPLSHCCCCCSTQRAQPPDPQARTAAAAQHDAHTLRTPKHRSHSRP